MPIVAFYERTHTHKRHTSARKPSAQNTQHSDNNHFRNLLFSVSKVYTKFRKKSRKIFFRRRSSKFFCEIFHKYCSSKFFVKSFTIFSKKEKREEIPLFNYTYLFVIRPSYHFSLACIITQGSVAHLPISTPSCLITTVFPVQL